MATYGEGPRISFALWAKAFVVSTAPAATATIVFMIMVIAVSPFEQRWDLRNERSEPTSTTASAKASGASWRQVVEHRSHQELVRA
jgi:hypothetical protein